MLALYISLLDTEEQISKFEHIYIAHRLGCQYTTATLSNAASKPSNVSINNKTRQL